MQLPTNAGKYRALSAERGRVDICKGLSIPLKQVRRIADLGASMKLNKRML
jgi:hypothetical protein